MAVFLGLVAVFINLGKPDLVLTCIFLFNMVFQASNGSLFWVYCADIATDATLGLCLFTLMLFLTILTIITQPFIDAFGVSTMF